MAVTETAKAKVKRDYPRTVSLDNNAQLTLRTMTADDGKAIMEFARSLPEEDQLFLRTDITQRPAVDQWLANLKNGRTISVLALDKGAVAGYASIHHNEVSWQRHLGEIRIQVGTRFRSKGLGKILAGEVFSIAGEMGLSRLIVQMTTDQRGAIATFEGLGFQREAVLQDYVIDRNERTRDMLIMGYDVTGLTEHIN